MLSRSRMLFQETNYQTRRTDPAEVAQGRLALQHGHRRPGTNTVSRRRHVRRRQSQHGSANSRRSCVRSCSPACPQGARRQPRHRAWRGHPEYLRHRRMAGRTHRARQAVVLWARPTTRRSTSTCSAATTPMARRCSTTTRCGRRRPRSLADDPNRQLSYFDNLQYKLIGHRNGGEHVSPRAAARNLNYKYPDVQPGEVHVDVRQRAVVDVSDSRFRADDKFRPGAGGQGGRHLAVRQRAEHHHRGQTCTATLDTSGSGH